MRELLYTIFCFLTAMTGATINNDAIFKWLWVACDFLLAPLVLAKWLWFHELTLSVLKSTFSWFFT